MMNLSRWSRDSFGNIEWKTFLPLMCIVIIVIVAFYFNLTDDINNLIRTYVVDPPLESIFFFIPIIVSIFYYDADTPGAEESELVLLSGIDDFLDVILSGMTYGYAMSASYLFLSKFFLQNAFGKTFFVGFAKRDLWLITFLLGYTFYWSAKNVYFMFRDASFQGEVGSVITEED